MRKINANKKAFTLVEMVLVVAIIMLIAVASLIGVNVYMDKANSAADRQEQHALDMDIVISEIKNFLRVGSLDDLRGHSAPNITADNNIIDNELIPTPAPGQNNNNPEPTAAPTEPTAAPTQPTTAPTQAPAAGGNGGSYSGTPMAGTSATGWYDGGGINLGGGNGTVSSVTVAAPSGITFNGVGNVTDNGDGTYTFSGGNYNRNWFQFSFVSADGQHEPLNSNNFYVVDFQ